MRRSLAVLGLAVGIGLAALAFAAQPPLSMDLTGTIKTPGIALTDGGLNLQNGDALHGIAAVSCTLSAGVCTMSDPTVAAGAAVSCRPQGPLALGFCTAGAITADAGYTVLCATDGGAAVCTHLQ